MIMTNTETISGKNIVKVLGVVKGNTIRARHPGKDILAALKGIVWGEIEEYTKLIAEAREQAIDRMVQNAEELGATATVNVGFTTSYIMTNAAEILVYGNCGVVLFDTSIS